VLPQQEQALTAELFVAVTAAETDNDSGIFFAAFVVAVLRPGFAVYCKKTHKIENMSRSLFLRPFLHRRLHDLRLRGLHEQRLNQAEALLLMPPPKLN
jgi:hypothetical protein